MKTEQYPSKDLALFVKRNKIATLKQLQSILGNPKERTVFRKLKTLDYVSSYSHKGMYYTLHSIAKFNDQGLWSHQSIWFSRYGNLLETAKAFIDHSDAGYSASELSQALHIEAKHCLLKLVRTRRLQRKKLDGCYVYFCADQNKSISQQKTRLQHRRESQATMLVKNPNLAKEEAKAAVLLFLSTLDERQRRLYAGLESLKLGYGGDRYIADLFDMDPHTVSRGRRDLETCHWDKDRLRAIGAGRLKVEKKRLKS